MPLKQAIALLTALLKMESYSQMENILKKLFQSLAVDALLQTCHKNKTKNNQVENKKKLKKKILVSQKSSAKY